MAVELRHLRYFLAVVEELHFGRAAARLHMAQPPISRAIRQLEDELGVQLLERTSRRVALTESGRVFADHARDVLAGVNIAIVEAQRVGGVRSLLRIGCFPFVRMEWIQLFLSALQERSPTLKTELTELLALPQVERLRTGELDIGIFTYVEDHAGIEQQRLFPGERLVLLLPRGHRLEDREILRPDDLRDEILVTFPRAYNPAFYDSLLAVIEACGYRFADVVDSGSASMRSPVLAAASGRGLALGVEWLVDVSGTSAVVARGFDPPIVAPDTVLAWRKDPRGELRTLIELARDAVSDLRGPVTDPDTSGINASMTDT